MKNIIERAYIIERTDRLTPESLPADFFEGKTLATVPAPDLSRTLAQARQEAIEDIERLYLTTVLTAKRGSIKFSAQTAGVTTRQLHKLITKHGLHKEDFKVR